MTTTQTTKEDFELFKAECRRWIEFWGLYDWEIEYKHAELDDRVGRCEYSATNKLAVIIFAKTFPENEINPREIKRIAFHEVDELRLATAQSLASERYTSDSEIDAAFHGIIRQDENKIFDNPLLNPKTDGSHGFKYQINVPCGLYRITPDGLERVEGAWPSGGPT